MSFRIACASCARGSASIGGDFDPENLRSRIEILEHETASPDLWDDPEKAEKLLRNKSSLEREIVDYEVLESALDDAEVLLELAAEADDVETRLEAAEKLACAQQNLDEVELRSMLPPGSRWEPTSRSNFNSLTISRSIQTDVRSMTSR